MVVRPTNTPPQVSLSLRTGPFRQAEPTVHPASGQGSELRMKSLLTRAPTPAASALLSLVLATSAGDLAAQSSNGDNGAAVVLEAVVLPAAADIDLDGRIDEDIWRTATPITDFTQQEPVEGGVPSEQTESPRRLRRGQPLHQRGAVRRPRGYPGIPAATGRQSAHRRPLHVDPRHLPGRAHRVFLRDQSGGADGRRDTDRERRRLGRRWRWRRWRFRQGVGRYLEARTAQREDGWSAEIRIPFRTLNFNPEPGQLGDQLSAHDPTPERRDPLAGLPALTRGFSAP